VLLVVSLIILKKKALESYKVDTYVSDRYF